MRCGCGLDISAIPEYCGFCSTPSLSSPSVLADVVNVWESNLPSIETQRLGLCLGVLFQQPPLLVGSPNWLPLHREYIVALGTAQEAVLHRLGALPRQAQRDRQACIDSNRMVLAQVMRERQAADDETH